MTARQRNAHYAMIDERFDDRSARLRELGFKYVQVPGFDAAAFIRPRPFAPHKIPVTVQASFVMCADDVLWRDRIQELEQLFSN